VTENRAEQSLLLARGERLGWTFRDRRQFYRPFPEPQPILTEVPHEIQRSTIRARGTSFGLIIALISVWLSIVGCLGLFMLLSLQPDNSPDPGQMTMEEFRATAIILLIAVTAVMLVPLIALMIWNRSAASRIKRTRRRHRLNFEATLAAWEARRSAYAAAEQRRIDGLVEWGAARTSPGVRRIDVIGGNLWGWEALLTVFGTSVLATRGGLTVLDLSGEAVSGELAQLASANGISVEVQQLPADLPDCALLVGLSRDELVNTLVEAMHGGAQRADRMVRSVDHRILERIIEALGDDCSMARIVAGVRVAMSEPGDTPELRPHERLRIADELFSDQYRQQVHENLRRIEALLFPLRSLGSNRRDRPAAQLTCVAVTGGHGAQSELLNDLVVQWLAHRTTAQPDAVRTMIIAGGDDLHRQHIERLADVCDRRSVRLVMLFRHLREASLQVLGAGAVAIMKLGNHEEATRAADFIGRQHKFVLTSLTSTLGGGETHGTSTNESETVGYGTTRSTTNSSPQPTKSLSHSRNTSRTWGTSESYSASTNWTNAEARSRVYEYTVEPRTLQDLPDYGMLLVESSPRGPVIRAVECNPDIISLARVSMDPLPAPEPSPAQFVTQVPAAEGWR
jgi:hypothetical protein